MRGLFGRNRVYGSEAFLAESPQPILNLIRRVYAECSIQMKRMKRTGIFCFLQQSHQIRPVQGLIFFGYNDLDPKTEPWTQVVRAYLFPEVLRQFEQSHPGHPLVAAFKPLVVEDDTELRRDAADYYRTIRDSDLAVPCKTTLQEVFVSWLEQRLKHLGKKEIEMILLGELPELEETQSGKDPIQIGEARGLGKAIVRYLSTRFGSIPGEMEQQIRSLSAEQAERLLQFVLECETVAEAAQWLRDI